MPGTETVDCPKSTGKTHLQTPSGEVIFTLIPNLHKLPPAQAARSNAVFMVSDHFHSPSPLRADNPLQVILHDGENYERTVYGLDKSGQIITKLAGSLHSDLDADGRFKMEQLISIPKPLLERVSSFRLVARPYQWTEFKDVALQPAK